MQGAIFAGGGDYPANEFIIGSGPDALLCRYKAGRRKLTKNDQLTLEWAGVFHHYHAADDAHRAHRQSQASAIWSSSRPPATRFSPSRRRWRRATHSATCSTLMPRTMEAHGLTKHRLNACGYSLGARFTPSWMDMPMFYQGNPQPIAPNMTLFAHMIIMDPETETAMTLGRTYLTTGIAARSRFPAMIST